MTGVFIELSFKNFCMAFSAGERKNVSKRIAKKEINSMETIHLKTIGFIRRLPVSMGLSKYI